MNVDEVIEKAGGVGKAAALFSVSHSTICDWKRTGFIPGARAAEISEKVNLDIQKILPLIRPPVSRGAKAEAA